jgi:hypothetical protein
MAAWLSIVVEIWGHGAMVNPPSRNAVDAGWNGTMPAHDKGAGSYCSQMISPICMTETF